MPWLQFEQLGDLHSTNSIVNLSQKAWVGYYFSLFFWFLFPYFLVFSSPGVGQKERKKESFLRGSDRRKERKKEEKKERKKESKREGRKKERDKKERKKERNNTERS